jgi:hypothetical protein
VQSIKIVSDNRESTTSAWTPRAVRDLVESRIDDVARAALRLREIALDLEPLRREHRESTELLAAYRGWAHFTTSEGRRLRRLLRRWAALEPDAPRELRGGSSAAEILEGIERRLLAIEREERA